MILEFFILLFSIGWIVVHHYYWYKEREWRRNNPTSLIGIEMINTDIDIDIADRKNSQWSHTPIDE